MVLSVLHLCLIAAVSGCVSARPGDIGETGAVRTSESDAVEYLFMWHTDRVHVYLTAGGAARVDLLIHDDGRPIVRTVFLPTNPWEVRRLVAAVDGLITAWPEAQGPELAPPSGHENGLYIRSLKAGVDRRVRLTIPQMRQDYVWEGVAKEIEAVAHADLARAIIWHGIAEEIAESSDEILLRLYEFAVDYFSDWAASRCHRYGVIWEPETKMAFTYPDATDDRVMYTAHGVPPDVMELEGITEEWAIKLLGYAWDTYTQGLRFTESDGVTVVSLEQGGIEGFYDWARAAPGPRPRYACGLARAIITSAEVDALKKAKAPF